MDHSQARLSRHLEGAEVIVDVRSPMEFAKGAIAGALNLPLFSDEERSEIGTLYKQVGQGVAIQRGLTAIGGRLGEFTSGFTPHRGRRLLVYCARGGMRSAAVVSLLGTLGHTAERLPGGYKAFRNYLLARLENLVPPQLIVLHGQTGVGKTQVLKRLPNSLDLEDLAQHRGSLFGGINQHPRTQQQFEAQLLQALQGLDRSRPVFVEGESRKVGSVILPAALMAGMKGGTAVLLTAQRETRVRRIMEEYSAAHPATRPQLITALRGLAPLYGPARTATLEQQLLAGNTEQVVRTLLVDYYDPRYRHAMRHYQYRLTLSAEALDAAAGTLITFSQRNEEGTKAGARTAAVR